MIKASEKKRQPTPFMASSPVQCYKVWRKRQSMGPIRMTYEFFQKRMDSQTLILLAWIYETLTKKQNCLLNGSITASVGGNNVWGVTASFGMDRLKPTTSTFLITQSVGRT